MRLYKKYTYEIIMIVLLGLLLGSVSLVNSAKVDKGMPGRVLSGEVGTRINLFECYEQNDCSLSEVSSSVTSYVNHGILDDNEFFGVDLPVTFELFIDNVKIPLQRFVVTPSPNPDWEFGFMFYHIFKPGDLSVGDHAITGIWSSRDIQGFVVVTATLPVIV